MNRKDHIFWIVLFMLVSFVSIEPARATTYRLVDLQTLGMVSNTPGTLAFWGKVLKVNGSEISFEVKEALRGDLKSGQKINIQFADSSKHPREVYSLRDLGSVPLLSPGQEVVIFATPNAKKEYVLVGGPNQGLFYVKYYEDQPGFYNSLGNQNVISATSDNSNMKAAIVQMKEKNTGAIVGWPTFKALVNGDK